MTLKRIFLLQIYYLSKTDQMVENELYHAIRVPLNKALGQLPGVKVWRQGVKQSVRSSRCISGNFFE